MKNFLYPICLLCCLFQSSCRKEKLLQDVDYLVIGYFNFAWGPNCEVYKLTPESLFNTASACSDSNLVFQSTPMSYGAFNIAQDLIHDIPETLFNGDETNFKGELCADCGGYFVEISQGGVVRQFSFGDTRSKDWPAEVRDFFDDFSTVISLLPQ